MLSDTSRNIELSDKLLSPKAKRNVILSVCSFILVMEFCERLAFYGVIGSLQIFFTAHLGLEQDLAAKLYSLFTTLVYFTPLLGAYAADALLGRHKTILIFSIVYVAGLAMTAGGALPFAPSTNATATGTNITQFTVDSVGISPATPSPTLAPTSPSQEWAVSSKPLIYIGLFVFVALGAGGIKPNVVVMGADQFDPTDPAEVKQKESFFNWFYWAINIGATFSFVYLTNLAVNGQPEIGIEKDYGFFASFCIPLIAFALAIAAFCLGSGRYIKKPAQDSVLSKFFRIVRSAVAHSKAGKMCMLGLGLFLVSFLALTAAIFVGKEYQLYIAVPSTSLFLVAMALVVLFARDSSWVLGAELSSVADYDEQDVRDAKLVVRLLPYCMFFIPFWAIYLQMGSNFVSQGCQMNVFVFGYEISSGMLNCFDSITCFVMVPVFDKLVYPLLERAGVRCTTMRKIGAGLVFCALSMVAAVVIEWQRKQAAPLPGTQSQCAGDSEKIPMRDISVLWQSAQYILVGCAEILAAVTGYELFYSQVPESMRSVCSAFNLLTTSLGGVLGNAVVTLLGGWLTKDLDHGHLEYVFAVFMVLMLINLACFCIVSPSFEYVELTKTNESPVEGKVDISRSRRQHLTAIREGHLAHECSRSGVKGRPAAPLSDSDVLLF